MLVLEFKVRAKKHQYTAIRDENAAGNILKLGLSTAGHSGTWLQDSLNALGEDTSTFSGEILSKQVTSVNKESPVIATRGA
ncbi:hypothetical protein K4A83_07825 [Spirulina subsalsa FACHB-351]|uniref:Transposase n=1 Tax=Spirulina subsalsa FACHB-351 TaxID=234711 RepID=A0ABT3L3Y0_9CYAN|nr:hypothetical protein [Spirulina subsalsa]MCW6036180.1 hypothetical protein [Spirulina subsalsa FACHB-351]